MFKKLILLAGLLSVSSQNFASTQTGTITDILVRDDGLHWIYVSGSRSARPECAANHAYWMIKDENSRYGQSQFSMLLAAYISGKTVSIRGTDTCSRWGDGESISTVHLKQVD